MKRMLPEPDEKIDNERDTRSAKGTPIATAENHVRISPALTISNRGVIRKNMCASVLRCARVKPQQIWRNSFILQDLEESAFCAKPGAVTALTILGWSVGQMGVLPSLICTFARWIALSRAV